MPASSRPISVSLADNRAALKRAFENAADVVIYEMLVGSTGTLIVYVDGLIDTAQIHQNLVGQLQEAQKGMASQPEQLLKSCAAVTQVSKAQGLDEAMMGVLEGKVLLLFDGSDTGWQISLPKPPGRGVEEPSTEALVRGPREGYVENLRTNTALLRRRIRSPKLKMVELKLGTESRTTVALVYMEGIARPEVIATVYERLSAIQLDGVLESGYIEEIIEDNHFSPFPQLQYTERPDTTAAQLLEGRFTIFVEGTPFALNGPITFWQMLQATEDYYQRYIVATLVRWLRYLFAAFALFLPGVYVAVLTFHHDMIPTSLLFSMAAAREAIPFPVMVEALIMEISFEALREAGVRLPKTIGQAVSIVGALVIGQAAVEAGIVSAPMVILVSLTGISSFTIPRYNEAFAIRILRFPMIILGGTLGLVGIVIGTIWLVAHLNQLTSFGVPYLAGLVPLRRTDLKDIVVRAPWWSMGRRPVDTVRRDRQRLGQRGEG